MARVRRWRVAPSRTRGRARARIAGDRGEERERAGEGSEATEPRASRARSRSLHLQAQRAASVSERRRQGSSPEGRRPRQRASWSRAGRSRARRNRARRPVLGPGGRADHGGRREGDIGSSSDTMTNRPRWKENPPQWNVAGVECGLRGGGLASGRRWRVSAEPDARPQGRRVAGGRCRERERRRREAPRRDARHRARRKKRADPSPKRRTGPCGWRSAALTRRCCRPGCRAGGPCRRGSR